MGYIYKITNLINGKIYIGQTTKTVQERFKDHIQRAFNDNAKQYAIHKAIRKYGIENFSLEILEECSNGYLDRKEIKWIKHYNSFKTGYNLTPGGCAKYGKDRFARLVQELWNEGYTMQDICKDLNLDYSTVLRRFNMLNISKNEIHTRARQVTAEKCKKEVFQYDVFGNYIRSYSNKEEAAKAVGAKYIVASPGATNKTYMGYQWRTFKTKKISPVKRYCRPKPVYQYDLDGNYITSFRNASEAARFIGTTNYGGILKVCHGKTNTSHGYRWSYEKIEMLPPMKHLFYQKKVAKLDNNENIVEIYDSTLDAAESVHVKPNSIRLCCRGKYKTSAGYKWKYLSNAA